MWFCRLLLLLLLEFESQNFVFFRPIGVILSAVFSDYVSIALHDVLGVEITKIRFWQ